MSYEKKVKDLLGRLVAMSPEPPPYPEEIPVASNDASSKRPHPVLVFVGAAVLVALLAVPVFLITGGQPPLAGNTTTTTAPLPATSTTPGLSTTTEAEPSTTFPTTSTTVASVWQGTVFLFQTPEKSYLSNPALVPIELLVEDPGAELSTGAPFTQTLSAIGGDLPSAFMNGIPADVQVLDVDLDDPQILRVDMNQAFLNGASGLLADYTMLNQLVYTLSYEFSEKPVLFTVNGQPVEAFGSEGIDLTTPVTNQSFIDQLAPIFLTEPIREVSEDQYLVQGLANTFEASLTVRVVDGDGNTVHEWPVQATCGTGCWGGFSQEVFDVVPGESSIQVFTYSAKDGSMTEAITVAIPENGVWEFTVGG
ncbi:MAG TPA: Gmad2 immunoglobulin-like domain-containing protein [Acidimicrobiia bacterium]|jgi:hypothetical protein|nr:Gmad2 immunoglobulin-like domain-containing protein [Acidimicrobiia bacterium]